MFSFMDMAIGLAGSAYGNVYIDVDMYIKLYFKTDATQLALNQN